MLESPNLGHMSTSTILFESRDKILLVMSRTEIMISQSLFPNTFILRRPRVATFGDIIKIVTMFIETIFKDYEKSLKN